MPACRTLTEAIHDNLCRLWCDGAVVTPHFVVKLLIQPRLEEDGRWTAAIVSAGMMLGFDPAAHRWELDDREVAALLPPTTSDRGADDKPRRSRGQDEIKQIADELWPDGYEHVETKNLIKEVGDQLERRGIPVPKRDVFLRALDRRKG